MVNNHRRIASAMAIGRISIGAAALFAPGPTSKLLGFPRDHDNATARLMGRLFGVRDLALGVLVWRFKDDPAVAPWIFRFNAAVDAGDAAATEHDAGERGMSAAIDRSTAEGSA